MKTEERTEIYYKRAETYTREKKLLEASDLSQRNKDLILAYANVLFAKGTKQYRVGKVLAVLRRINELFLKKDLDKLEKADVTAFAAAVNTHPTWSDHTKRDYNRVFKQFINWWRREDPRIDAEDLQVRREARKLYEHIDDTIKTEKPKSKLTETEMITDDEYQELITKGCSNPMERAFIALIHERPVRIGEVLRLRIKHFHKKGRHAFIDFPEGKTGPRSLPFLRVVPYMQEWLKNHPDKENPEALLWVSIHNGHYGRPLRYPGARKLLFRVFKRAGWLTTERREYKGKGGRVHVSERVVSKKKKWNSHHFRHSRVTWDCRKYSDGVICAMAGFDAKQLKTYSHIGALTVEKAFLEQEGLAEAKDEKPTVRFCGVCGEANPTENSYCYACGNALDVTTLIKDEEKKNHAIDEAMKEYADIMSDPARAEKFLAFFRTFEKVRRKEKQETIY